MALTYGILVAPLHLYLTSLFI